jgi:hypothetical protein
MIALWRGLVWTLGSLSVAVLLREAFDVGLVQPLHQALAAYDAGVAAAHAPVEPWLTPLLPLLSAAVDGGTTLYPHWTHVFLVALLHMLPRIDATYGAGGIAAGAVWCLQAIAALALALVVAAEVGAAPFIAVASAEGLFIGVFVASALCISAVANFRDSEEPEDVRAARDEAVQRWWARYSVARAFGFAFILAIVLVVMVGLMTGWLDREGAERTLIVFVLLWFLTVLVRWIYAMLFAPRDEVDDFLAANGLAMNVALLSMFVALMPLADYLTPQAGVLAVVWVAFLAAMPVAALFHAGRGAIGRLIGQGAKLEPPATPALGIFLAGGAAILFANFLAS